MFEKLNDTRSLVLWEIHQNRVGFWFKQEKVSAIGLIKELN